MAAAWPRATAKYGKCRDQMACYATACYAMARYAAAVGWAVTVAPGGRSNNDAGGEPE
jgi:hypothetical protein